MEYRRAFNTTFRSWRGVPLSIGCQLLISTARFIMKDRSIDRAWLCDVGNSLRACAC
jgi:hypothetical protein